MSQREKRAILALIFIWFSFYTYLPQLSPYARELGASYQMVGLIGGAYGFSQSLVRIPLGILSDIRGQQKPFIVIGALFAFLSAGLIYLFPSPLTLLFGRFIAGLSAATWVNFTVLFSGYYPPSDAPKANGILSGAVRAGMFTSILAGGILSFWLPLRVLFLVACVTATIGFIAATRIVDVPKERKPFAWNELGKILTSTPFISFSLLTMISQGIVYATTFSFTPIIAKELGAEAFGLSVVTLFHIFPQIIAAPYASGTLLDRFGGKRVIMIGFIVMALSTIATPYAPNLTTLYLIQIFTGLANAMTFVVISGLTLRSIPLHLRSASIGFFQSIFGIGMVAGPVVSGIIAQQWGLNTAYLILALLSLIAVGVVVLLSKRQGVAL